MAAKKRSYTAHMRQKKHHARGYFADLGRKGGNSTKARHHPSAVYYSRIGKLGGQATKRRRRP